MVEPEGEESVTFLRTLVLAVLLAAAFSGLVYWLVRASEPPGMPEFLGSFVRGDFSTERDPAGKWTRLQLRSDGTCSRQTCWTEGPRQVSGVEEAGRWMMTSTGALELSWDRRIAEPVTFFVDEKGHAELRLEGQPYRELVPFDCY